MRATPIGWVLVYDGDGGMRVSARRYSRDDHLFVSQYKAEGYKVTHRASGYSVSPAFEKLSDARLALLLLADVLPWQESADVLSKTKDGEALINETLTPIASHDELQIACIQALRYEKRVAARKRVGETPNVQR